ncbi:MAG: asparagine synthetase B family protein [Candidatus Hodarchaeales archaeon]|jgi:asparagine synthase (glutamine-hydrolysing)
MCGILLLGPKKLYSKADVERLLTEIKHRGPDFSSIYEFSSYWLCTTHLKITGSYSLPVVDKEILVTGNAEIYNYKDLFDEFCSEQTWDPEFTDLHVIPALYRKLIKKNLDTSEVFERILNLIKGVYSLVFIVNKQKLFIARDTLGIRPLFIAKSDNYAWVLSSEQHIFHKLHFPLNTIQRVPPGSWAEISSIFFQNNSQNIQWQYTNNLLHSGSNPDKKFTLSDGLNQVHVNKLQNIIETAISLRIPTQPFGIFISGGIDSSILLTIIKNRVKQNLIKPITVGFENSPDLIAARLICDYLNLNLEEVVLTKKMLENTLPRVVNLINNPSPVDISIALPLYFAAQRAKSLSLKVCLTGQGADEVFIGYNRYYNQELLNNPNNLRKIVKKDIINISLQNIERDDSVTMYHSIEMRFPYLDLDVINWVLMHPIQWHYNIDGNIRKLLLRKIALNLNIPEKITNRKKKAVQYGTHIMKYLKQLAKQNNLSINELINRLL